MPTRPELLAVALDEVGDRWSLAVVDALLTGHHRFGELQAALPGLAPNVLSRRLKQLEEHGLAIARAYQQRPPRFAYEPTERARALAPVIEALVVWAGMSAGTGDPDEPGEPDPIWV